MPLKEAEKSYQYSKIEEQAQKFWEDNQIFSKVFFCSFLAFYLCDSNGRSHGK